MYDKIPILVVSESNPIPVGCKGVSLEFRRLNVRFWLAHVVLAPAVQNLDSAIHWINRYPEDKYYENQLRYPVDSVIHLSKNWGQVSNFFIFIAVTS